MDLSEETIKGLNVALNEASILGVEFNGESVGVTFNVFALDVNGNVSSERKVLFVFNRVGRFVGSYRLGRWDDQTAKVVEFQPQQIFEKVSDFKQLPIYGWDFIDSGDKHFQQWKDRLSFDYRSSVSQGLTHTIDLFQEGDNQHIDIRIWFGDFQLLTPTYAPLDLQTFIENGKRAWDGIYSNPEIGEKFGVQTGPIPYKNLDEGKLNSRGGKIHNPQSPNPGPE